MAVQLIKNVLGDVGGALLEHFYALTGQWGQVTLGQTMAFVVSPLKPKRCCFVANGLAPSDSMNLNPRLEAKIHAIC